MARIVILFSIYLLAGCCKKQFIPEEIISSKNCTISKEFSNIALLGKKEINLVLRLIDDFRKSRNGLRKNEELLFVSAKTGNNGNILFEFVTYESDVYVLYIVDPSTLKPIKRIISTSIP